MNGSTGRRRRTGRTELAGGNHTRLPRTFRRADPSPAGAVAVETVVDAAELRPLLDDFQERLFRLTPLDARPDLLRSFEDPSSVKAIWRGADRSVIGAAMLVPDGGGSDIALMHILPRHASAGATQQLLEGVLRGLPASVSRVRAHDRLAHHWLHLPAGEARKVLIDRGFAAFDRVLLTRDLGRPLPPAPALPPGLELRGTDASQADAYAKFAFEAYRGTTDFNIITPDASPEAYLRLYRRFIGGELGAYAPRLSLHLSDPSGTTVGVVHTIVLGRDPYVGDLSVAAAHRRKGLGRALLVRALNGYREAGHTRTGLTVTAQNTAAYNLYRSVGFEVERSSEVFLLAR